jgi:hypothetical protein
MISAKCFTQEWVEEKSLELRIPDKNLIEKVIHAFSLLDLLARSGCPFYFKGGTCLMLVLAEATHRLSIDIDIMCPPETPIEQYLNDLSHSGFIRYEMVERQQAGKNVPKSHSKFFYQVAYKGARDLESFILLDVLYEDCHYAQVQEMEIVSPFIATEGEKNHVIVPSAGDILGDKLTAFAPETTGVPYFKNGKSGSLEIIKQLYDIGRLFDKVDDLSITAQAFQRIGEIELGYRDLSPDISIIYEDIINTALNISLRGLIDHEKFTLLQDGINRFKPFLYNTSYYIENAIVDAAKAAYLAALLKHGVMEVKKYSRDSSVLPDMATTPNWPNKLNKLKKLNPEAYYYWVRAFSIPC